VVENDPDRGNQRSGLAFLSIQSQFIGIVAAAPQLKTEERKNGHERTDK
jgi:hypothetical protein